MKLYLTLQRIHLEFLRSFCLPHRFLASIRGLLFAALLAGGIRTDAAPQILLSPFRLDFSRQAVGKPAPLLLTVTNGGNAPLTLKRFNIANERFSVVSPATPRTLAPGTGLNVIVQFLPTAAGVTNGTLAIASDDPARPDVATGLTGEGVPTFDCYPAPAGLLAWWRAEGTTADQLEVHPAVSGHGVGYADGRVGRAFNLDGTTNHIEVADHGDWQLGSNGFTIEAWANFAVAGADAVLVAHHDGAQGWRFGVRDGKVGLHIDAPGGPVDIASPPLVMKAGEWQHLAATRSGSTFRLYLNGDLVGQMEHPGELPPVTAPLTLGQSAGAHFLKGLLDEVSLYSRALSADELHAVYLSGVAGKCAGQISVRTPPQLRITSHPGGVGLAWTGETFQLEGAGDVTLPSAWKAITDPPVASGSELTSRQAASGDRRFFRLRGNAANSGPAMTGQPTLTTHSSVKKVVPAATGGTLVSGDGRVALSIPGGALDADREITMTDFVFNADADGQEVREIVFEPAGLTLAKPASVTVKFAQPDAVRDPMVFWLSTENPPQPLGSEISQWRRVAAPTIDVAANTVSVPVGHFSVGSFVASVLNGGAQGVGGAINRFYFVEQSYLVFELDGKYLKKGDLLYALSKAEVGSGHTWIPGHTGLFLGNRDPGSNFNDGQTVIESTPEDGPLGQTDGVQYGRLDKFMNLSGNHVFMGARRPLFGLTETDRGTIANWAVAKLRVPYSKIGGPFLATGSPFGGLSCVGLTEGAYEAAGKSIVPGLFEAVLWPLRQFVYTKPVDEVSLVAGDKFNMFLDGVIRSGLNYSADPSLSRIEVSADPDSPADQALKTGRAQLLTAGNNRFQFQPTADDAELTHVFKFTLTPEDPAFKPTQRRFFVHVRPLEQALVRQDVQFVPQSGLRDFLNFDGVQTATITTVVTTNRLATMTMSWQEPPATLASEAPFEFPVTVTYKPVGVSGLTFANRFLSGELTAFYWDAEGIVQKQIHGNVAFVGGDTHQKPVQISTNSTFNSTVIDTGRKFTLATIWLRVNGGINGTAEKHPLYDLFWNYTRVP